MNGAYTTVPSVGRLAGSPHNKDYEENPCRILPKFASRTSHNPNVRRHITRPTPNLYIRMILFFLL